MRKLRKDFSSRGPWVTCFTIEGKSYGGRYHAEVDHRLRQFLDRNPNPGRMLELGCLEGGHTIPLAQFAEEVVAIDGRPQNLHRAGWIREQFGLSNITFLQADLEEFTFDSLGQFDSVFNVGLLYHLRRPMDLLRRLAPIARSMFLWTHVAPEELAGDLCDGYAGMLYEEHGIADPLSGMRPASFWPTLDELARMLRDCGFEKTDVLQEEVDHPHGPTVTIWCESGRIQETARDLLEKVQVARR